ncbi:MULTISPECIES: pyrimidine dimer DNA glycosylase/endonuclease V [unclassified Nitrospina]|uniref:pyrimidine dimer DNA glycosylase/endonuclease V n=1 Tax=unclassified Nitrospina TaxID=2638683 RepID=UPI003F9714B0
MNIFILDRDFDRCARYHCDRHVGKMILESAQMLSTALRVNGVFLGYRVVHLNHPCTLWTRASLANWRWLRQLAEALNREYRFRFDKKTNHRSWDLIASLPLPPIADVGLTPFAQAMPDSYKHKNAVKAYRNFYCAEKRNLFKWTRRTPPEWIQTSLPLEPTSMKIGTL